MKSFSTRKRMSVIVRTPDGKIKVMTKGADNVIFERLAADQDDLSSETLNHLKIYANEGIHVIVNIFNFGIQTKLN